MRARAILLIFVAVACAEAQLAAPNLAGVAMGHLAHHHVHFYTASAEETPACAEIPLPGRAPSRRGP